MHDDQTNNTTLHRLRRTALGTLTAITTALLCMSAQAQNAPVTGSQRATAQQVAQQGVPLAELAPNAPDTYVVKRGDTLWGISGIYLLRPWRWPELWGMNLQDIANPHLIFPGQTLYLDKQGGYARLRTRPNDNSEPATVRVSPRTRSDSLANSALPTLKPHLIEPFLVEPMVVDEQTLLRAPRIVATTEDRVLMSAGDRAYARSDVSNPLRAEPGEPRQYRVFRDAVPLKDPGTGEILGYEAQYLGKAELVHGESVAVTPDGKGGSTADHVPATVDITATREEIRAGDRLLPAPERTFISYTPHAPEGDVEARVVSIYGSAFANAAQNQVIAINMGEDDGIQSGHVLNLMTQGDRIKDTTADARDMIKLPSESNGMAMVFRTFDRISYALILDVRTTVRVGDRLITPR